MKSSAIRYTFTVHERLKREQHIKTLFQSGKAFSSFPLKCIWLQLPRGNELSPVRMGVSAPKKRTPLAVNRNRLKRLVHEAWRLQKHKLYQVIPAHLQLHVFFIFTGQPNPDFVTVEHAVLKFIEMLLNHFPLMATEENA